MWVELFSISQFSWESVFLRNIRLRPLEYFMIPNLTKIISKSSYINCQRWKSEITNKEKKGADGWFIKVKKMEIRGTVYIND